MPDTVYPLLHVGVHELPLARLDVHGLASPFAGAVAALHALALHTAVLVVSVPAVHALVPVSVYPLLHVGVHELPLARLAVHGPASPFVGAADASHALPLQANVLLNVPAEHDLLPDAVYPLLHVGVHELSIARLDVQSPRAPFVGAVVAWQVGAGVGLHANTPNPH